jgi:polysaccharide export outer membrane protein
MRYSYRRQRPFYCGFLVDANGNIEYPRLGSFHVEGLTKQELAVLIKKRLTEPVELLKSPLLLFAFQVLKYGNGPGGS